MAYTRLLLTSLFFSLSFAQFQSFVTRPHDKAVNVTVLTNKSPNALAPGLFFITPYVLGGQFFGPQIFTGDGTLIWYGNQTASADAFDEHVCNYRGSTTLCYNDGVDVEQGGHSTGKNVFLNHHYTAAGPGISGSGGLRGPDNHETNTPESNGALVLQTVFQPRPYNLKPYNGVANGTIEDGCFQDINLNDGSVSFQWCASDHMKLDESYVLPWNVPPPDGNRAINHVNELAGDGSPQNPYDWFHINSVDRDQNGDYLVSGRHTSTIYKVSGNKGTYGTPGSILWRLGGKHSTFTTNYNFSSQHMARFVQSAAGSATVSLFDDASDGTYFSDKFSSGKIVSVDTGSKSSKLMRRYISPVAQQTVSQGSMQVLPNNNAMLGWGSQPYYSEFAQDGTLLYHAVIGGLPGGGFFNGMTNYRAYKTEWLADPAAPPDLVVYAQNCTQSTVFAYASWNGATSVARWRFRGGPRNDPSTWTTLIDAGRTGYETGVVLQGRDAGKSSILYVVADAMGTGGRVLATSRVFKTFVPDPKRISCGFASCPPATDYLTAPTLGAVCRT